MQLRRGFVGFPATQSARAMSISFGELVKSGSNTGHCNTALLYGPFDRLYGFVMLFSDPNSQYKHTYVIAKIYPLRLKVTHATA